ncbi:phosphate starvation protein PhoH [Halolactibacillus alkaliphilus]|uniref:PhoH-like protein n=1 Tax=Halolactibacillus alkaliphilus TaxID=442899 RepID=A0A511X390_9BACI|nr:PhoH family protein [Halolactibacillus alkaliphilus]GEN57414.1 phosphate starvation protein PhoH [Halolactibacillus alkaliphilus]GGN69124.1 phosphate starvation protein PhoH [Halolactibacillus alkaliphilus]SFO73821.1 phosphate starvation-inducible protein PhoH [Halolactibacillus alkaliphilus]
MTQLIDLIFKDHDEAQRLFGSEDRHLHLIEDKLNVTIITRGEQVRVGGDQRVSEIVESVLKVLIDVIRQGNTVTDRDVIYAVELALKGRIDEFHRLFEEEIMRSHLGQPIRVKTIGQREYVNQMKKQDVVFGIGPAGTGKTFLAVVMAVKALKKGDIKRIILTRPAVEAGESLGFLPGDLKEKVDPYLRPLYDSLHAILGQEHTTRLIERGTIEIAPLAYMRGRTLDDAYVILDEAQNTTPNQMKMFLTRLGFGSKMIVTGDITQVDLPRGAESGLRSVEQRLNKVSGVSFVYLKQQDVVRHPVVQRIIEAYEE